MSLFLQKYKWRSWSHVSHFVRIFLIRLNGGFVSYFSEAFLLNSFATLYVFYSLLGSVSLSSTQPNDPIIFVVGLRVYENFGFAAPRQ